VKWVIACLVVINATFFVWQLGRERPATVPDAPEPAASSSAMVNRLLLVSELDRGVLRQRLGAEKQTSPAPAESHSEADATGEPARSAARDQSPPLVSDSDVQCYTVGPLDNADDISALADWFSAQGSEAKLRTDERREVVSTWVFVPPLASREAADARVREMQEANIDDIYVIPRGDMANAISLGLYSQEESLERRISELERRGFSPSVLPRYRTVTASWFDVITSAAQPMTVGVLDQIFPDLIVRRIACAPGLIAGDPAIPYNRDEKRREDSASGGVSGATSTSPERSTIQ